MPREFGLNREELDVLQSDLDDESPQVLGALVERLLSQGALDAHLTPLLMKKNRPGVRVEVLCRPADREKFLRLLMTETSTLGVKVRRVERYSLDRSTASVKVRGRQIAVKVALLEGRAIRAVPEFAECAALAQEAGMSVKEILEEARAAAAGLIEQAR